MPHRPGMQPVLLCSLRRCSDLQHGNSSLPCKGWERKGLPPLALSLVSPHQRRGLTVRLSFQRSLLMGSLGFSRSESDLNQKPKTRNNKSPRNSPGHRLQVMCQVRRQEGHQPLSHLTLAWLHLVRRGANQDEVWGT